MNQLSKNLIKFRDGQISDSSAFNYMLSLVKRDLNDLFTSVRQMNSMVDNYIILFDEEKIEQTIFRLNELIRKYNVYSSLLSNEDYTLLTKLNFSSEAERLPYKSDGSISNQIYIDPKRRGSKFTSDSLLHINTNIEALQLPLTDDTIYPVTSTFMQNGISSIDGSLNNIYFIRGNPTPINTELFITLKEIQDISYLSLSPETLLSFNVDGLSYLNNSGNWIDIPQTSRVNVFSKTEFVFGTVNTKTLKVRLTLNKCKATNRIIYYLEEDELARLLLSTALYGELENYDGDDIGLYNYFIFHFGYSNVKVGYRERLGSGIFAGNMFQMVEPAQFSLRIREIFTEQDDVSVEYYLFKKDYNKNSSEISTKLIPILPHGKTAIVKEVLIPITDTSIGFPQYHAILNFYPDVATMELSKNGLAYAGSITTEDNIITFTEIGFDPSAYYTINYTPYFKDKIYPVPVEDPEIALGATISIDASEGEQFAGNIRKFILPHVFKSEGLVINRFINEIPDLAAPVLVVGGNVTLAGRVLTISDYDIVQYPKLIGATYEITGDFFGSSMSEDILYYYNPDNSLLINWDAFANISDYDFSELSMVIIMRKNTSSITDPEYAIDNVELFSNGFNDLLKTITNFQAI